MGTPNDTTIPELQYTKPDGTLLSRIEMEQQIKEKWSKPVHWLRLMANKIYGLPKAPTFDMREAVLRHWVLDEMVRKGQVTGNLIGVNVQTYNYDAAQRQFLQSLVAMVQSGNALLPNEGEGVDMNQFTKPPPTPMPPHGRKGK